MDYLIQIHVLKLVDIFLLYIQRTGLLRGSVIKFSNFLAPSSPLRKFWKFPRSPNYYQSQNWLEYFRNAILFYLKVLKLLFENNQVFKVYFHLKIIDDIRKQFESLCIANWCGGANQETDYSIFIFPNFRQTIVWAVFRDLHIK